MSAYGAVQPRQSQPNELVPVMGERQRRKTRLKTDWPVAVCTEATGHGRPHLIRLRSSEPSKRFPTECPSVCAHCSTSAVPTFIHYTTPLITSLPSLKHSISAVLLIVFTLCTLGTANEDSRFALRPFQASPHQLTRRQDVSGGPHLHPIPVLDLPPVARRDPNLVPILTAPVARGSVGPKPSFQRIRLNKPSQSSLQSHRHQQSQPHRQALSQPPLLAPLPPPASINPAHFTPSEPSLTNFQRLVGFSPPPPQSAALPSSVLTDIEPHLQPHLQPPTLPSDAPRQSFRRIKPSTPTSGSRRIKIKTSNPLPSVITPSRSIELHSRRVVANSATPVLPPHSQRLRGRGPVNAQDEDLLHKDNALDNEDNENGIDSSAAFFGNRVSAVDGGNGDNGILLIESLSRSSPVVSSTFGPVRHTPVPHNQHQHQHQHQPQPNHVQSAVVHTPTIPLTYYTTFTYFTTVLRGPHTAMLSRELVSTTTQVKPIDRSIVTAIEFSEGYIQPSKGLVALGTKTKGQTTTIYNMASRVQVYNDDLYKVIYATRASKPTAPEPSSSVFVPHSRIQSSRVVSSRVEPTRTLNRPHHSRVVTAPPPTTHRPTSTLNLDQLNQQPKKLLNKYTYYYTFIDGTNTRYSTRHEESTSHFAGNLVNLAPSLAPSLDSSGLLQILSTKSATMPLGSRAHGRMTTVVNLALNNYVQFDSTVPESASHKIRPTQVVSSAVVGPTLTPSLISSSFEDSSAVLGSSSPTHEHSTHIEHTPRLSSDVLRSSVVVQSSAIVSSKALLTTSSVRTRPAISRRPIRVKVKPIRSKLATLSSRVSITSSLSSVVAPTSPTVTPQLSSTTSPELLESPSPSPVFIASSSDLSQSPTAAISQVWSSTPTLESSLVVSTSAFSRKKVTYTVRSRLVSGTNRFRRPSSYLFQRSSVLISSVVPEVSATMAISSSPVVQATPSFATVASSSPQVTFASSQVGPSSPSPSPTPELSSTPVVKPTKATKSRLVVLTRLAGALNKWNPLYASRVRVSSRKVLKSTGVSELSSVFVEPTSRVETVFETTTHTVPFTLGTSTIYTTLEETNSRVVTRVPHQSDVLSSPVESSTTAIEPSSTFELTTQLTTVTHYDTVYTDGSSVVTSSEQTLSSVLPVSKVSGGGGGGGGGGVSSTVVVTTSDVLTTSTLYSTYTYFATLFNGTQTMITPLEEVKTEYLTLREPVVITKTLMPESIRPTSTPSLSMSSMQPTSAVVSAMASDGLVEPSFVTETHSTHTTLTHFITLFSGTRTILSSIEEISPTVMTRTRVVVPTAVQPLSTSVVSSSVESTAPMSPSIVEIASEPVFGSSSSIELQSTSSVEASSSTQTVEPSPTFLQPSEVSTSTVGETSTTTTSTEILESVMVFDPDQADRDLSSAISVVLGPSTTLMNEQTSGTTAVIVPGSTIELDDLLKGSQDAGQIGEAIKDIVNNIVTKPDTMEVVDEETTTPVSVDNEGTTEPNANEIPTVVEGTTLAPSFTPSSTSERPTPSLSSVKARFPLYVSSKHLPKYQTTSEEKVIFSTQSEGSAPEPSMSTRYVTSIERSIKTLTLTSTKVYYTRDSPLTITNVLTTTLPPMTYVSTIIGSKTILGTYNSITPTRTSLMTETTATSSSSTATLISVMPVAPTTRPRLHRPKNQEPTLSKAKVTPFLNARKPPTLKQSDKPMGRNVTISPETELCTPACNLTNKEHCREGESGKYSCECRPGYVRRPSDNACQEIKNYLVVVRVSKTAESEVSSGSTDKEAMQSFARVARRIGHSEGIAGLQVVSVDRTTRTNQALVNLTVQLDHPMSNVHEDLSKQLQPLGQVERVVDFDECSSPLHNDCSARARCINEPGSYRCECADHFIDLDQSLPGRLCVSEVKSCDYCYGRGDCWRQQDSTVCRCHPMFIGRRCEINGLLLAILVPIVAILVIVAIVCFLYCSRKLRQRNRRFKNLAAYGPVAVIGGTLDRKAMLETSSESSDPQHRSSHYNSESNPASARGSMARRTGSNSRRESEPSLDRSLTSYSATGAALGGAGSHYNSLPPQILIPRARPPYTLHPGQVYMW